MVLKKEFIDSNEVNEPKKSYDTTENVHKQNGSDIPGIVVFFLLSGAGLAFVVAYIFEDIVGYGHDATPFVLLLGFISGLAFAAWGILKADKDNSKPENADAVVDYIRTIMLIDNDPYQNNALMCEFMMRRYFVLTAASFGAARVMLEDNEPDLILMETDLPDGDGFDFYKEIRGRTSASIIFLTVKSDDMDMARGLTLGVDAYIRKPFNKELTTMWVENIMKCRRKLGDKIHSAYTPVGSKANK